MSSAADRAFVFVHLKAPGIGWQRLAAALEDAMAGKTALSIVGRFMGLFGLDNHELFALLAGPSADADVEGRVRGALPPSIEVVDAMTMRATARPTTDAPLQRDGLYVFRFFDVRNGDVDEVVQLSRAAWQTFDSPTGAAGMNYTSEPMALFRATQRSGAPMHDADAPARMLLLTWYDNFTSWERSRAPAPEAAANFRRRAALTSRTIAYATRAVASSMD